MSSELVLRDPLAVGQAMFKSRLFPDVKSAEQAVVKVLAGAEYGLGPVAAMNGIHIIDDKPVPSAHVLAGLVKRSGRYTFRIVQLDGKGCKLTFHERNGTEWVPLGEAEFTLEDAKRAGLLGRKNWQRYPRNMLFCRALSSGVRWHCPDVTATGEVLTAEEWADERDIEHVPGLNVKEQPAPQPVPNEAQAEPVVSGDQLAELRDLYARSGWVEEGSGDPHKTLRWQLIAAGVPSVAAEAGDLRELLPRLTVEQAKTVRAALLEAVSDDA